MRELLSDEEFKAKRRVLVAKELELKEKWARFEGKHLEWFELSERAFSFASQAEVCFRGGTAIEKREIMSAFGLNLVLKDRDLALSLHKPFLLMEEGMRSPGISGWLDGIRTFFLEHPHEIQWPRWVDEIPMKASSDRRA